MWGVVIQTVQVQSSPVSGSREDMLFERVVTKLKDVNLLFLGETSLSE